MSSVTRGLSPAGFPICPTEKSPFGLEFVRPHACLPAVTLEPCLACVPTGPLPCPCPAALPLVTSVGHACRQPPHSFVDKAGASIHQDKWLCSMALVLLTPAEQGVPVTFAMRTPEVVGDSGLW